MAKWPSGGPGQGPTVGVLRRGDRAAGGRTWCLSTCPGAQTAWLEESRPVYFADLCDPEKAERPRLGASEMPRWR